MCVLKKGYVYLKSVLVGDQGKSFWHDCGGVELWCCRRSA